MHWTSTSVGPKYSLGTIRKGYLFHASRKWKGRDFTSPSIWNKNEICHLLILYDSKVYERGSYHLSMERLPKGYLFLQKWYRKGKGSDLGEEPLRINFFSTLRNINLPENMLLVKCKYYAISSPMLSMLHRFAFANSLTRRVGVVLKN